jgi:hypothetical protein
MLSHVAPPRRPKCFGFGRAYTDDTGTTNRIPSTDATSPPPHALASPIAAWCSISVAFAARYVASPQIRLVDVREPPVLQSVDTADHRGVADVAAVRHQQRRDRHGQVLQAGLTSGDRGERLVGAGPGEHLQQYLGQVDAGQHRVHRGPQVEQRGGLGFRLQGGEVQPTIAVEDDLRVVRQPPGDLPVRPVQQRGPRSHVLARPGGQVQRGQHGGLGLLPCVTGQQFRPRVAPLG